MQFTFKVNALLKAVLKEAPKKIVLVKDSGVYLMPDKKGKAKNIAYAVGHGPKTFIGGDDFGESFPKAELQKAINNKATSIKFKLTRNSVTLTYMAEALPASKAGKWNPGAVVLVNWDASDTYSGKPETFHAILLSKKGADLKVWYCGDSSVAVEPLKACRLCFTKAGKQITADLANKEHSQILSRHFADEA